MIGRWPRFTIFAATSISLAANCRRVAANTNARSRRRGGSNSPEWQARALSGLADAQYMDCRMATALRHFADCVDLCDAHGLPRIAAPNSVMMGHCRIYSLRIRPRRWTTCARDSKSRSGSATAMAQMFATHSLGFCLTAAGRYAEADEFLDRGAEAGARAERAPLRGRDSRAVRGSRPV